MEKDLNEKKYRAVRDAILKLFSDGYCHTLKEIEKATKKVSIMVVVKDENRTNEVTRTISSGFNDACIKKLQYSYLSRSLVTDPDYEETLRKTLALDKWKDRPGRTPKFFLLKIAPKMHAKQPDNVRTITTREIEECYKYAYNVNAEAYAKERAVKDSQFTELQKVKVINITTNTFPITKDKLLEKLPPFVKGGTFSMPSITRIGVYKIKIRFGKGKIHDVDIIVSNEAPKPQITEPETAPESPVKEPKPSIVEEPKEPSLEEVVLTLKSICAKLGLVCEITLK